MLVEFAKNVSGIRKCKWIPQTLSGVQILFFHELAIEQLKARADYFVYSNVEFWSKELTIINEIHVKNLETLFN